MTKKSVSLAAIAKEDKILKVVDLLFSGKTKKAACAQIGVDEATFDRMVAQSPELVQGIQNAIRVNFSSLVDEVAASRRKNVETLLDQAEAIRSEFVDMDFGRRTKAIGSLLKIDTHLSKTMDFIYPIIKETPNAQPSDSGDDAKAMEILATVRGAKLVRVTRQTISLENDANIIDA